MTTDHNDAQGGALDALARFDIGYTPFGAAIQPKANGAYVKREDVIAALAREPAPQSGECPACHKAWGEHRSGYSASACRMKKPQAPADAGEAEPTREERIALLKGLSALDALSEAWAAEINLDGMCANLAKAADVPAAIRAMAVQAYVEGAYAGRTSHHPAPAHAAGEERAATLWCLHIVGPDDVHPAPSREHAQRAADLFNAAFADKRDLMHAVASPWPHTPASHAKSVDRFIADWMVPRGEVAAAAPPPPAGDCPVTSQGVGSAAAPSFLYAFARNGELETHSPYTLATEWEGQALRLQETRPDAKLVCYAYSGEWSPEWHCSHIKSCCAQPATPADAGADHG